MDTAQEVSKMRAQTRILLVRKQYFGGSEGADVSIASALDMLILILLQKAR